MLPQHNEIWPASTIMKALVSVITWREAERQNVLQRQQGNDNAKGKGSCDWLISHMTMRDFFLYSCLASDARFYHADGIPVNKKAAQSIKWRHWDDANVIGDWERWATGNTGLPLVDAAMSEMVQTGYCSNRVRQNAASVLTKDLGIDWRAGAEWFQFLLCDHCVGANWGNWLYFSGKGSDPKNRHFRTVSQALRYDEDGMYVMKWLPELNSFISNVESNCTAAMRSEIHLRPWDFTTDTAKWKATIVSPKTQYTWHDMQRLEQDLQLISAPNSDSDGTKKFGKADLEQWIPMMKQGALHKAYQLITLAALQKLDEVLHAADIEYWASGGTLLGALRHQGFIPHDDDIDIECRYADLERISTIPVDENYLGFEKGSVWKGFPVYKMKFRGDVSVDVFPRISLDAEDEDKLETKYFPTRDEVFPLAATRFCNIQVSIPHSRDVLQRLYGKDCFENVLVWNHDFNFEHGKGFDQRKVVVPLEEYSKLLNEYGVEQPIAGKTAEETYRKAFAILSEDEFTKQLKSYRWQRTLRWNRADAEWRFEQQERSSRE
ncbi:MAG: hypothetical protein SGARI_000523 [Bacillariaceae sp.]